MRVTPHLLWAVILTYRNRVDLDKHIGDIQPMIVGAYTVPEW